MSDSFSQRLPREGALFDDDAVDDQSRGPNTALAVVDEPAALVPYRAPTPGRSLRTVGRFFVLVGGSAVIGVGVATGVFTLPAAAFFAVGLATGQVLAQTWRQNKLGQSVVGGISLGDLDAAQRAAEKALTESPAGVMRTLAASNLASVLIQQDLVDDAARVLDQYPPGFFHMPLTTVLWLNNRAFAHLATANENEEEGASAAALLDEAEKRLLKASLRELGGQGNARKLTAALSGTRAIERALSRDGRGALNALKRATENDDGPATAFRTIERELCRTEALRLLGRTDEATITLESLTDQTMTARQHQRRKALQEKMGLS
ncbi:MAG: tetratricopeptide repeat protein [Deltaproteobacteria bacterium]|nr:tetratricopeptide repeat protein [Deltaproteobacteria bacterium]